jgi:hypothetical protein
LEWPLECPVGQAANPGPDHKRTATTNAGNMLARTAASRSSNFGGIVA